MRKSHSTTISLTVDVEGEWSELPGEQGSFDLNKILAAVHNLEKLLYRMESRIGARIPVTWFIRCDDSVAITTGEASGLLKSLDKFILRRTAMGDEFGLHPHLYNLNHGKWASETNPDMQKEQVERAAIAWDGYFGSLPRLTRMGEAIMNNTLANCISQLGVEIDSSALVGRKRFDSGFQFDWTGTPASPYYPSVADYRIPAATSETARSFIEVPFTMLPIKGPKDKKPINRYCNLAFRPDLIKSAVKMIQKPENIIAVVHPHELLSSSHQHAVIAHNPASIEENILNLYNILGSLEFTLLTACVNDSIGKQH